MRKYEMKRVIAAALCLTMLAQPALVSAESTPSEAPLVETVQLEGGLSGGTQENGESVPAADAAAAAVSETQVVETGAAVEETAAVETATAETTTAETTTAETTTAETTTAETTTAETTTAETTTTETTTAETTTAETTTAETTTAETTVAETTTAETTTAETTTAETTTAETTDTETAGGQSEAAKLSVSASVSGDTISVTLSGNKGITVDVTLYDTEKAVDSRKGVADDATLTFSGLAAGLYSVFAEYTEGGASDFADVEVEETQSEPTDPEETTDPEGSVTPIVPTTPSEPEQPSEPENPEQSETPGEADGQYTASVSQGKGELSVTVTGALSQGIWVELTKPDGSTATKVLEAGNGTVTFTGLAAGVYSVYLDYAVPVSGVDDVTLEGVTLLEGAEVTQTVSGQFSVEADVSGTAITVTVSGAKEQPVDVVLIRPDNTTDVRQLAAGNGTMQFTGLSEGSYSVVAAYQTSVNGVSSVKKEGLTIAAAVQTASAIAATASGGVGRVDVNVTSASALPVAVTLLQGSAIKGTQRIEAGVGAVAFTGLPAGTYSVSVDYAPSQQGVKPYQLTGIAVTDQTAGIAIAEVKAGENKLTVKGTAQPNTDVTLTTEPSSAATIVRSDAKGNFSAEIVCGAGTYTAVYAQYGADSESRVSMKGSFVVTAQATKPSLAVDPITVNTVTVAAKTTPGTVVSLATSDYGQTLTADSRGMLQYSLPHTYAKGTNVTFTVYYGANKENNYQVVVAVTEPSGYRLLKRGTSGSDVLALTTRLKELGYPISATSSYNDTVVSVVKLFQQANGLSVDGQAGTLTQTALYSVSAIGYGQSGLYPTLVRGDKGIALIYTLQQRLKDLGYYTIRVDGIFGSGTQRAVRDFQAVNGLTVTGKADHATQQLLYSAAAKPAGSASSGSSSGGYVSLSRSSRYDARVVTLQRRLKALGYLSGSVDGYFGSQTYRAVRNFQSRNGISATGVADVYTQQVLYSAAAKAASSSSSGTSSSTGYRLLYWGCKGDAVTRLQKALLAAGYTQVRVADGIYGQWTYDGVRAYQKDHGLAVDGVAGKNTQNSLYGTSY